jgi:hypothetical protein
MSHRFEKEGLLVEKNHHVLKFSMNLFSDINPEPKKQKLDRKSVSKYQHLDKQNLSPKIVSCFHFESF